MYARDAVEVKVAFAASGACNRNGTEHHFGETKRVQRSKVAAMLSIT